MQGISFLPGWGEKNFQVLGKAFELITQIAASEVSLTKKDAFLAVGGLVPKLSDTKLKGPAFDALSALAEVVGPQFVCGQLHKQASLQKNPKVASLALAFKRSVASWSAILNKQPAVLRKLSADSPCPFLISPRPYCRAGA